ncbi:MAG: formyltransferase family protein [Candidatus Moranbacteria bacterium]|nr:formyltransferase family protein [Candidatus Moranbacteria bacterium]
MSRKSKLNLILIASGRGTDATAIMAAWRNGRIPEVSNIILVSTCAEAECLERAAEHGVKAITLVPPNNPLTSEDMPIYQDALAQVVKEHDADMIFLVGCNVIMPLIMGVPMFNIHPAHTILHGGYRMHGLRPHLHVLAAIQDEISRGMKKLGRDTFFTYPTVHEVTEVVDGGPPLLQVPVEIPEEIIRWYDISKVGAAELLQKHVLPFEWEMLPKAVSLAAGQILSGSRSIP